MTELTLKMGNPASFAASAGSDANGLARPAAAPTATGGAHTPAGSSHSVAALELRNVSLSYGHGARRNEILKDVNLSVAKGEFVAIVGFSGSGKTTLVSLLAGLAKADSGLVLTNGEPVTGPGPDRGIVFQSYSLMPWLTVRENVALAVDRVFPHLSASERADKTVHYVSMVGLTPAIDKKPAQLSGGMRQRVSVARALATNPEVLLMDEPLSALDALTRSQLQDEIVNIWDQDKKTVLLITNDVDEALIMADRVIPLTLGPGATLGQAFDVNIARPRDRLEMNHDKTFQSLRAEITSVLLGMSSARKGQDTGQAVELPSIRPRDVSLKQSVSLPSLLGMRHAPLAEQIDREATEHAAQLALPIAANAVSSGAAKKAGDERYVEFSQVIKVYPTPKGPQTVVDGFDIKIKKGEFISLIGHSGCGKSTVLSMVAGLTDITSGAAVLDGREVTDAGPDRGIVFQSPSLIPWLTAYDNVMIGVDRVYPHATAAERADMVGYYLNRVGLGDAMKKRASELSNGMKQRVGIARAFALSPKLLLLDEPFGMLDALTRWDLQEVLMEVWAREKVTAIMVTHDVDEAILLADRVVMMSNGPNAKIGHVMDVTLERPRTRKALLAHPRYYELREELIGFLASCGHQH